MKAGAALAAVMALAAIAPSASAAAQRYAAPGGTPADPCTQADPCDFETAVEGAADTDEVIVQPGVHTPAGQVSLTTGAVVHGADGQPVPRIDSAAGIAISVNDPQAGLRRLDIRHTGAGDALLLDDGTASTLSVRSTGVGIACHVHGATLRDSICVATGAGGDATGTVAAGSTEPSTISNVTAIASGTSSAGLRVEGQPGGFADLRVLNTIAKGAVDTVIQSDAGGVAVANVDYSNFATQNVIGPNSFASPPGSARNQTAAPQFIDPSSGAFDEDLSSPTIDAGTFEAQLDETDVNGDPRVDGFGVDIGAQEFPAEPPAPDTNPPDTRIIKKPKKRAVHRLSKFKFGTTEPAGAQFMCSLDGKPFTRCDSPKRLRVKRGPRHRFSVYSIDESGNADPTPDEYTWKVKQKQD